MRDGGRRPRRKRSPVVGRPNELGGLLADLRTAKGLSLRQVEEATDKAVSNAYLSQLENGKIKAYRAKVKVSFKYHGGD